MTSTLHRDSTDTLFRPLSDADPATPGDPFTRLRYHYGQCLSAEDFETEQRYFVLRRRLHNALLHGVGTAWGLHIRNWGGTDEDGALRLVCEPGMAIDPLGREIWVPQELCLDLEALASSFWETLDSVGTGDEEAESEEPTSRRAYVVLRYEACLTEPVPAMPVPCGEEQESLLHSRVRDSYRLCLEAQAPEDPYATVRDITLRPRPAEPRQRLLRHALNRPIDPEASPEQPPISVPLGRFWSGADDAALLLATVDLAAIDGPVDADLQLVQLAGGDDGGPNPDNSVRAVLPAVQALADLALGVRLEGVSAAESYPPFQVLGVIAERTDGSGSSGMQITVRLSKPVLSTTVNHSSVRLFVLDGTSGWVEQTSTALTVTASTTDPAAIVLGLSNSWIERTTYQVGLSGTGAHALLSDTTPPQPLAGSAGEIVRPGTGRDAHLFATYSTPST